MPAKTEAQRRLFAIAEHHPEKLHEENKSVLKMSHSQLHDFASTKGLKEHSPVHFLKREGVSLESSKAEREAGKGKSFEPPDYTSQKKSNPHEAPAKQGGSWMKDHGEGNRWGEKEIEEEDRVQKGKSPKSGPRTDDRSTELSERERENNL